MLVSADSSLMGGIKRSCSEWKTAEEIAAQFGKHPRYIRDIILPKLTDVMEKMYDVPYHPKQKYRTTQSK